MSIDFHILDWYVTVTPWGLALVVLLLLLMVWALVAAGEMLYRWLVPGRAKSES